MQKSIKCETDYWNTSSFVWKYEKKGRGARVEEAMWFVTFVPLDYS